jgi:hypothetical protein
VIVASRGTAVQPPESDEGTQTTIAVATIVPGEDIVGHRDRGGAGTVQAGRLATPWGRKRRPVTRSAVPVRSR